MKHTTQIFVIIFLLAGIVLFPGCNKSRISGLVNCEGTVTWKGDPVEGARVAFLPKSDPNGRGAFGVTDTKGKFKATTLDTDDGIMPGEYFVTVTKRTSSRDGAPPPPAESDNPDAPREGRNVPTLVPEQISVTYHIPEVYANSNTSGLTAVISSKGEKNLEFELVGEIQPPGRQVQPSRQIR